MDQGIWPFQAVPAEWEWAPFDAVFSNETDSRRKIPRRDYALKGALPIIDQGQTFIAGLTDKLELRHRAKSPVIVFGDHTRSIKLVDFPFVQGADGVKVLGVRAGVEPRFAYYALRTVELPSRGYGRHFKLLSKTSFPLPPIDEQRRIVAKIEALRARSQKAREALGCALGLQPKLRSALFTAALRGDLTKDIRACETAIDPAEKLLVRIREERRSLWEQVETTRLIARGKPPKGDRWKARYTDGASGVPKGPFQLPRGWLWTTVGALGLIESGQTPTGIAGRERSPERTIPWFRVGDMNAPENRLRMTKAQVWLSPEEVATLGLSVRPAGTILFPKRGGAIATNKKRLLGQEGVYDLNIMSVLAAPVVRDYLWWWFQSVDLSALNTGVAVPQINHGDIASLCVPLPPEIEMKHLVRRLARACEKAERASEALSQASLEAASLEASILAKALCGELSAVR